MEDQLKLTASKGILAEIAMREALDQAVREASARGRCIRGKFAPPAGFDDAPQRYALEQVHARGSSSDQQ